MATLYGLTLAEARGLARMADGLTPAEAARSLGMAPRTDRAHLLRLCQKTGTHQQAELARLAAALSAPAVAPTPALGGGRAVQRASVVRAGAQSSTRSTADGAGG